jgi:hypothetical protein
MGTPRRKPKNVRASTPPGRRGEKSPRPSDTLTRLQQIAKKVPGQQTPPVQDLSSSAQKLANDLNSLDAWVHLAASTHRVQISDVLREIMRRNRIEQITVGG